MEIRKIGYVAAVFTAVVTIVLFLISTEVIKIDTSNMLLGSSSFTYFGISAAAFFCAFWLLSNSEHTIVAFIDIAITFIYALILVLFMMIPKEDSIKLYNVFIWGSAIAIGIIAINIPLLVRTQSKLHRYYKYGVVIIIVITCFLAIGLVNSLKQITNVTSYESYEKLAKSMEASLNMIKYGILASFIGILCNPMIGYASSDGLGGSSGSSKTPKLVDRNAATDPNMGTGININQGINYGNAPIPEGVVASNQPIVNPVPQVQAVPDQSVQVPAIQVAPVAPAAPVVPVAPAPVVPVPVAPVLETVPQAPVAPVPVAPVLETVPQAPVAPVQAVPSVAPAPIPEQNPSPTPATQLKAEEVAPELQFLLNNNNNK